MSDEEADVVVIGPGMGGLAAARTIAQFGGKQVLVLEQHYTLGGMTHEFSRAGRYRFGTGLHYMSASAGPFLGFMTDERAQLSLLPDEYDVLHFPGFDFAVPATKERLRARLKERFPAEADAIDGFFRTTRWAMAGLTARNVFASFPAGLRKAHAIAVAAAAAGVTEFMIGTVGGAPAFACSPGQSVLDAANAVGVALPQSCGEGACGTCRVRVLSGVYETDDRGRFSADELAAGRRLACQTLPTGDLVIDQ